MPRSRLPWLSSSKSAFADLSIASPRSPARLLLIYYLLLVEISPPTAKPQYAAQQSTARHTASVLSAHSSSNFSSPSARLVLALCSSSHFSKAPKCSLLPLYANARPRSDLGRAQIDGQKRAKSERASHGDAGMPKRALLLLLGLFESIGVAGRRNKARAAR